MDAFADRRDPAIHVVVTCANRKRQTVPERLRLQNLNVEAPEERCAAWLERLSAGSPTTTATDMYAGEHWQVARNLPEAVGPSADLWVSSAGYGLIPAAAPIHAYAATFASGQPDSVATTSDAARRWWFELSNWGGPCAGEPRSFAALAERNPNSVIIAVMSDAYLRACSHDLNDAASKLTDAENISVFGPPGNCSEIDDLIVPVTAALRPAVGGSLQALNVRAADHVLRTARESGTPLRRSLLIKLISDATAAAPADAGRRPAGMRLSDEDVRIFIREHIADGPTSATKLLRLLRDSGLSCEQARFKALFAEVSSEVLF
ncbi:hypothetical protein [Nocardia wallacei]|uniref:hypothetical protein n=1 Tax=Nocardia wallacei TaxID=480035 RepID=UPI0024545E7C|nr:hypothetical protein [Nocardia wallacei]